MSGDDYNAMALSDAPPPDPPYPGDWDREPQFPPPGGEPGVLSPEEITQAFSDWVDWFCSQLEVTSAEKDHRWCPTWWVHTEVALRLAALWKAYMEAAAGLDERSMSSWWVDQWDRHRTVIFGEFGPFRFCTPDEHHRKRHGIDISLSQVRPPSDWLLPEPAPQPGAATP